MDSAPRSVTLKEEEGEEFQKEMIMQETKAALVPKNVPEQSSRCKYEIVLPASNSRGANNRRRVPRMPSPPPYPTNLYNQEWGPCISSWKENRTTTYPPPIEIHFGREEEGGGPLDVAEQEARERVSIRRKMVSEFKIKEREREDQKLRALFAKALQERNTTSDGKMVSEFKIKEMERDEQELRAYFAKARQERNTTSDGKMVSEFKIKEMERDEQELRAYFAKARQERNTTSGT